MKSISYFKSLLQLNETKEVFSIWPTPPAAGKIPATIKNRDENDSTSDRLISGVSAPELMVYRPVESNGVGIVVFPGGGYQRISIDNEGRDVGNALTPLGYTVFVATYRMPGEGHSLKAETSLADAQRAIRWVRSNADKWNLNNVGILGFSAGGHLAGQLATRFDVYLQDPVDEIDKETAKPDFCALMYPVVTMNAEFGHQGSAYELLGDHITEQMLELYSIEKCVHSQMPACFVLHANDDKSVPVENSIVLWQALRLHRVPVEMHLFNEGGHGFGVHGVKNMPAAQWPLLLHRWISYTLKASLSEGAIAG